MDFMDDYIGTETDTDDLSLESILSEYKITEGYTQDQSESPVEQKTEIQVPASEKSPEGKKQKHSFPSLSFKKKHSSNFNDNSEEDDLETYDQDLEELSDYDDIPDSASFLSSFKGFGFAKKNGDSFKNRISSKFQSKSKHFKKSRQEDLFEEDADPYQAQPENSPDLDQEIPDFNITEKSVPERTSLASSPVFTGSDLNKPSDEEINSFLEAFRSGDYLNEDAEFVYPPSEPDYTGFDKDFREAHELAEESDLNTDETVVSTPSYYDLPELDMSPDENYVPPKADDYYTSAHTVETTVPESAASRIADSLSELKNKFTIHKRIANDFDEPEGTNVGSGSTNIDDSEEDWDLVNPSREFATGSDSYPVSFKDYLTSVAMTVLYKLRGAASVVLTMEDNEEDLGPEVSPQKASSYYSQNVNPIHHRLRICAVLLVVMGWISLGLPVVGMLKTVKVASATVMAMQFAIMLLCLDAVTNALMNAVRGKFGFDTLAVITCLITALDAFLVACSSVPNDHLALCFISSLALTGVLNSSYIMSKALYKTFRVPAIGQKVYSVSCEHDSKTGEASMLKTTTACDGFVRHSEEVSPDENMYAKLALPIMAVSFLLGFITAIAKHDVRDLIYFISVYFCAFTPFCGLLCFALPFFFGAFRIFRSGASISAWTGIADIGHCQNIIISDHDLFPAGNVKLAQVRIISEGDPNKIISYTGSILKSAETSLANPFLEYMSDHNLNECLVRSFEYVPGGGLKAVINSQVVLCGNRAFMYLMKVPVSADFVDENSVLLAVNGELSGIFNIEYSSDKAVKNAILDLIRSDIHPIFAVRDFNVTPKMLKELFGIATDGYDFPPYDERFSLSSLKNEAEFKASAVVCCEGLAPLVHMAQTGKSIYSATVTNLYLGIGGSFLVCIITFLKIMMSSSISAMFFFVISLIMTLLMFVNSYLQKF